MKPEMLSCEISTPPVPYFIITPSHDRSLFTFVLHSSSSSVMPILSSSLFSFQDDNMVGLATKPLAMIIAMHIAIII